MTNKDQELEQLTKEYRQLFYVWYQLKNKLAEVEAQMDKLEERQSEIVYPTVK